MNSYGSVDCLCLTAALQIVGDPYHACSSAFFFLALLIPSVKFFPDNPLLFEDMVNQRVIS